MDFLGAPRPDVPFPMAEMTELPAGGGPKTGGANLGPPPPTAQRRSVTGYDATEDGESKLMFSLDKISFVIFTYSEISKYAVS